MMNKAKRKEVESFVKSMKTFEYGTQHQSPLPTWKLFIGEDIDNAESKANEASRGNLIDVMASIAEFSVTTKLGHGEIKSLEKVRYDITENLVRPDKHPFYSGVVALDATLYATVAIYGESIGIPQTYIDHIKARWEVFQRGYYLNCAVGQDLYVYAVNGIGEVNDG